MNFNPQAIKKSTLVDVEMVRLRANMLQTVPALQCLPYPSNVMVALLIVRSIVAKVRYIKADPDLMSANVLCFCLGFTTNEC